MDIKQINLEISKIKNPIIFLFLLISDINKIHDNDLSIILRLYLKHHIDIAINYNLKKILINELVNHNNSKNVLNNFYKLINKKVSLIFTIKKLYEIYNNKIFWKLQLNEQIDFLQKMKEHFLSVYDCSRGGIPYFIKLASILKTDRYNRNEILTDIKNRLIIILTIFTPKIFQTLEIPLININDFYELSNDELIKYLIIIYEKLLELLNQTIKLFDIYNIICTKLSNLLNPVTININLKSIDSEIEPTDIIFFCNN
jgi:hypothetical protein